MKEVDRFLEDETSPENTHVNLRLAVEAYERWRERLSGRNIKSSFLGSCATNVPYYQRLFSGRACCDVREFPIIDRALHNTCRRHFLSRSFDDPRLENLSIYTNGTFAPTLRVSWDLPSLFELNHASYLRFAAVRPALLTRTFSAEATIFVISDSTWDKQTSVVMPALNATILRRLVLGRSEESDAAIVRYLRGAQIALLHGKSSVLSRLVDLDKCTNGQGRIFPATIACSGENLYPDDRARLESWFCCGILEAYVASETGMVSLDCPASGGMHVLSDHLTLEVLTSNGTTASSGSGELLVTNALNWRHAFIRYCIGDRATVVDGACSCGYEGQTIVSLPGRERESYGSIPSEEIAKAIAAVGAGVKQYQVEPATDHGVVISWIPDTGVDENHAAAVLNTGLTEGLAALDFELRRVQVINKPGGKLRRFL